MASPGRAAEVMRRLRAIGVKISIDDFGTGHSSLAYLTTLPNDELKVDRSFIQAMSTDPNAETVVRAIVDLARSLRLDVVAEGRRDRRGRRRCCAAIGCATGQGYLFSRPLPARRDDRVARRAGLRAHPPERAAPRHAHPGVTLSPPRRG